MKTTFKSLTAFAILTVLVSQAYSQNNWAVDKSHSNVQFTVTHLVISEVEGHFRSFDGTITASKPDFTDAAINFTVDVASVSTDNDMRDNHLKADDFFHAEKFPKMTFKGVSFKKVSDKKYELTGDLTIRDVTRKVKFDVTYGGTVKDGYGNTKAGFKVTATLNRFDYNLKWNSVTEAGGVVVGPDVDIRLNLQFGLQK